jgi:hypothetical protein
MAGTSPAMTAAGLIRSAGSAYLGASGARRRLKEMTMAKIERSGLGGRRVAGVALAFILAALCLTPAARADSAHPFDRYLGVWRGTGRIETVRGNEGVLACTATCEESEGGKALAQSIHCNSKIYSFAIENYIVASGDQVVGNWRELTMQVQGSVTGQIQGTMFIGKVVAPAVTASVWMRADQRSQAVRIVPQGVDIAKVEIVLRH